MSPALFTTGQSRWALHIVLGLLSAVAIASSAPPSAGGATMFSGDPGDIRGIAVILGSVGLGGVLVLRLARIFFPKPWRIYLDRIEFDLIAMLWICWTSATMAFSAFTLHKGVCSTVVSDIFLPTCPLLTVDLALLHLLSTCNLALLLVILSTALSPLYYLSLSPSFPDTDAGGPAKVDPEATDAFVMWDLALASPPSSPRLDATPSSRTYGTSVPATPITPASRASPSNPYQSPAKASSASAEGATPPRRRDRFAEGRIWSYVPLAGCSLGVAGTAAFVLHEGKYILSSIFMLVIALLSLLFSASFLAWHRFQRKSKIPEAERRSFNLRHDRALEIGLAGALFLLWPLAAIAYTLFPPTANRPCSNPSASAAPLIDPSDMSEILCRLSVSAVALAWLASWIILARVMGLIIPMPEMGKIPLPTRTGGEESTFLLRAEVQRPQVGYGRIIAGEAFELGDDED